MSLFRFVIVLTVLYMPLQSDFVWADDILYLPQQKTDYRASQSLTGQFLAFDTLLKGEPAPYDGIILNEREVQEYYSTETTALELRYKVKALQYQLDIQRQECERKISLLRHQVWWTVGGVTFGVSLVLILLSIVR